MMGSMFYDISYVLSDCVTYHSRNIVLMNVQIETLELVNRREGVETCVFRSDAKPKHFEENPKADITQSFASHLKRTHRPTPHELTFSRTQPKRKTCCLVSQQGGLFISLRQSEQCRCGLLHAYQSSLVVISLATIIQDYVCCATSRPLQVAG
jgi:hypothetical protein